MCSPEPSLKTTTSVVPAPMSMRQTPSSISLGLSTAWPDARPWLTTSSTSKPAWCTHLMTFWIEVWAPVTMWVSTSSREPVMPAASFTPSWPSTVKLRGITCTTSRSLGTLTAREASTTRSTSWWPISWSSRETAITPRLFCELR